MHDVSFIIAIDSSFEMTNNFFEELLKSTFVKESEVVIVNDVVDSVRTLNYLNLIHNKNKNIKLINLETKTGYGKANNIGVDNSEGKYLFLSIQIFLYKVIALTKCTTYLHKESQPAYSRY